MLVGHGLGARNVEPGRPSLEPPVGAERGFRHRLLEPEEARLEEPPGGPGGVRPAVPVVRVEYRRDPRADRLAHRRAGPPVHPHVRRNRDGRHPGVPLDGPHAHEPSGAAGVEVGSPSPPSRSSPHGAPARAGIRSRKPLASFRTGRPLVRSIRSHEASSTAQRVPSPSRPPLPRCRWWRACRGLSRRQGIGARRDRPDEGPLQRLGHIHRCGERPAHRSAVGDEGQERPTRLVWFAGAAVAVAVAHDPARVDGVGALEALDPRGALPLEGATGRRASAGEAGHGQAAHTQAVDGQERAGPGLARLAARREADADRGHVEHIEARPAEGRPRGSLDR